MRPKVASNILKSAQFHLSFTNPCPKLYEHHTWSTQEEGICSQKAAARHKTENHSQNPEDTKMSATLYAKGRQFYNNHILPTAMLFEFGSRFTKNNYFPNPNCMVEPWSNQLASLFHERKKSVERISSVSLYMDKRSLKIFPLFHTISIRFWDSVIQALSRTGIYSEVQVTL